MLILDQQAVTDLLPIRECIDLMVSTLSALARGETILPLRTVVLIPDTNDAFAVMPAYIGSPKTMGAKIITVYPGNHGTQYDSHQGAVLLFDPDNGSLAALLDATAVTTIRTAAVSAVATWLLARPNASTLAIVGAGVQAHAHLESMCAVRPIKTLRIWSRTPSNAERLADVARTKFSLETTISASCADAVRDADVICTTTSARAPVLFGEWLTPGTHINAIGASQRTARELDTQCVVRSRLYVDRRESALKEPGDTLVPLEEGAITPDHIVAEIGELAIGRGEGRRDEREITLFKSLGLAIEDLAAASYVYNAARRVGVGVEVELGGARLEAH
ncbi:MAG TPA: ornithine cyclodeaminase family protein [Gemmatimonadaceae bacterium]|jgi:ornithine cyclodeaminase|nr:ornithine cyclodeaminase family protein [Gemmatimonadaceae bacterium]